MKNRMRETRSSGSVGDGDGNVPIYPAEKVEAAIADFRQSVVTKWIGMFAGADAGQLAEFAGALVQSIRVRRTEIEGADIGPTRDGRSQGMDCERLRRASAHAGRRRARAAQTRLIAAINARQAKEKAAGGYRHCVDSTTTRPIDSAAALGLAPESADRVEI